MVFLQMASLLRRSYLPSTTCNTTIIPLTPHAYETVRLISLHKPLCKPVPARSGLTWLECILNCPSGLPFLVARRATSMLGPMPALAVQPVASKICCRIDADTSSGSPSPVTSRYASSHETGWTHAVAFSRILYTCGGNAHLRNV